MTVSTFASSALASTDVVVRARALSKKVARWADLDSESGVTAIEYGLIAALVAVVIITAVALLGTNVTDVFTSVAGSL
jgi:pilus assembly protein Flp/PilA